VVDRLVEAPSPAAVRGTLVHAVLDRLFDLPAPDRTLTAAEELVPHAWATLKEAQPELEALFAAPPEPAVEVQAGAPVRAPLEEGTWLAGARALLANYFQLEEPSRLDPHAREEYVEATLGDGLVLRGIIDRLDRSPGGDLRVVDYKTGSAPGEAWESKALFQLKFYALVLWRTRGVVPKVLQLLYLADRQRLTYSPQEDELIAVERQLVALWRAVEQALRTGDFRARKGPLCAWCDHQALCPEFGGQTPPYPFPLADKAVA